MCSGKSAVFASRPAVINASAVRAIASGCTAPASSGMSSVP
ncbi:MAG: hypothetical protein AW08_00248 [Candidatus Accumulibacter adjunctus]|uniref:Uncharacterized protein n=1 Tax=Candidatus Accumulibacter adjunctus TaxID=1454001 RepID=A0A011NYN7_9PROT|nr:MAG: hypothetical protein AW08_00248 [Candidatus Accumulibacter adjunctus]